MQFTHFIGIDVSKETLDICVFSNNKVVLENKVKNDQKVLAVIKKLIKQLKIRTSETLWCLEHTGIYCNLILSALNKLEAAVWFENPTQIKLSQGLTRGKNDKIDAKRIAIYAYTFSGKAKLWKPKSVALNNLNQLTRMRNQLMDAKHGLSVALAEAKIFLTKETYGLMAKNTSDALKGIIKNINDIDEKMKEIISADVELKKVFDLAVSVQGIGPLTAMAMIITTNAFKDFTCPKKYNCYAGLAPFEQQSGKSLKLTPRVSQRANKEVKRLLHMAALNMLKYPESEYAKYYKRKKEEGKNGMTILNAIRAKLVARVFACIRDQRPYTADYKYKAAG